MNPEIFKLQIPVFSPLILFGPYNLKSLWFYSFFVQFFFFQKDFPKEFNVFGKKRSSPLAGDWICKLSGKIEKKVADVFLCRTHHQDGKDTFHDLLPNKPYCLQSLSTLAVFLLKVIHMMGGRD